MTSQITLPIHGILFMIIIKSVYGDELTVVEFPTPQRTSKRGMVLHPDQLDVRFTLQTGELTDLTLVRQRDLDLEKIPVIVDGVTWRDQSVRGKRMSFYQDADHMAAVSVTAELQENGELKRSLSGCLITSGKAFEIHPTTSLTSEVEEYLQQRGLEKQQVHKVHTLKEFDLRTLLQRLLSGKDTATRTRNSTRDVRNSESTGFSNTDGSQRVKTDATDSSERVKQDKRESTEKSARIRRMASEWQTEFNVEMYFMIDHSIYKYWRDTGFSHLQTLAEIKYYYTHIFNSMRLAYDSLLFYSIDLWLTTIEIFTTEVGFEDDVSMYSDEVFEFMRSYIVELGYDWTYPDHYLLWTKKNLLNSDGDIILGSSYVCGVCDPGYQMSVNMDEGFFGWVTGAHELGHNLGALHDAQDNGCSADQLEIHIMAFSAFELTRENLASAFTFSSCSEIEMYNCLLGKANIWDEDFPRVCVYNHVCSHQEELHHLDELPGQKYDLTTQCSLLLGNAGFSENCVAEVTNYCQDMFCDAGDGCSVSHTIEFRAAPGTPCGLYGNDICFHGECVPAATVQYQDEYDANCETIHMTIADDCLNTKYSVPIYGESYTCDEIVLMFPWKCFPDGSNTEVIDGCSRTCMEYGLFYDNQAPCEMEIEVIGVTTTTPPPITSTTLSPTTTPVTPVIGPPTYLGNLDIMFCDTSLSEFGGVRCPSNPAHCVPLIWVGDGVNDCEAWEDENIEFCQKVPCPAEGYVRCYSDPNLCIQESWLCDGTPHCPDGSDETEYWCTHALTFCYTLFGEPYKGYNCPNDPSACVPKRWTCDQIDDCGAQAGEIGDESMEFCNSLCPYGQIRCPGVEFACIPVEFACNGERNCPGGDEESEWCKTLPATACLPGYFQCKDFKFRCVPDSSLCDGKDDCHDNSDEAGCVKRSLKSQDYSLDYFLNRVSSLNEQKSNIRREVKVQPVVEKRGDQTVYKRGAENLQLLDLSYLRRLETTPIKKSYKAPDDPKILNLKDLRKEIKSAN